MFESLSQRIRAAVDKLRGRGRITEADLKATLREIRMSLLEADVNFEVAKNFVNKVQEKTLGQAVLESLTPAEQILSVVYEELVEMLGGEARQPLLKNEGNLWFMVGLQGSGKTTTSGKLAHFYKSKGRRPLLVAADTQRPAAREQLRILGEKIGVPVLEVADGERPETTRARLQQHLTFDYRDLVIVDTAGRLQIDQALMDELARLKQVLGPSETLLVVDSMTGQEALNVSKAFDERIGVTGLILTKLDGDARGGAALSARYVTGKPIYFAGVSEKIEGLEPFYPDRLAQRILGMGDLQTLLEKARQAELEAPQKDLKEITLEDLIIQMRQMRKMGSFTEILGMIPGLSRMLPPGFSVDEKQVSRMEAIVLSMTPKERRDPRILNASRRKRIAAGSGTTVQEVNRLIKTFEDTKQMLKTLAKQQARGGRGLFRR
ncbi:signal recognition particle protein [Meiothermus taiwanensis]|jgi:signal recognition particle subunit SRP54|uniref:Signal recognition particle protein n=2 Tax=Meiothermus taiwanensis TaxID=172827 RepID=A0A399E2L8_9DEIN|nr:signal recognition particle protein [Meiothermus taiwanensis]AWR87169.1 signal recognition particle protein [Meiothermus taiwanensis WR-220]KIQ55498.1 signal recognition particle [Meiothermus taiwanensis]KZK14978.1 signal recognition particle protein [Meiothermus taiwanensis]RIH78196.1 Signal recognition particle protein [Meiothermus taiwanensis]